MGKHNVKIFIACGSGIVTSTLAADAVKRTAKEINVPVVIKKGSFMEIANLDQTYELVLTTANYRKEIKQTHLSIMELVSRVNEDKKKEELKQLLCQLYTGR